MFIYVSVSVEDSLLQSKEEQSHGVKEGPALMALNPANIKLSISQIPLRIEAQNHLGVGTQVNLTTSGCNGQRKI